MIPLSVIPREKWDCVREINLSGNYVPVDRFVGNHAFCRWQFTPGVIELDPQEPLVYPSTDLIARLSGFPFKGSYSVGVSLVNPTVHKRVPSGMLAPGIYSYVEAQDSSGILALGIRLHIPGESHHDFLASVIRDRRYNTGIKLSPL